MPLRNIRVASGFQPDNLGKTPQERRSLDKLFNVTYEELRRLASSVKRSDPGATLDYYISHRRDRLAEVEAALAAGDRTTDQIVARIYHDVDQALWPFAAFSVRAALQYLADQGALPPGVQP